MGLLPLARAAAGPSHEDVSDFARALRYLSRSAGGARCQSRRSLGFRIGARARQWRLGKAGRLHAGIADDPELCLLRLQHPLRIRHVPPEIRKWRTGRASGELAKERIPVGVRPPERELSDSILRPRHADEQLAQRDSLSLVGYRERD